MGDPLVPMSLLGICLAAAGLGAALLLKGRLSAPGTPALTVSNYRGRKVPAIGGPVLLLSLLVCTGLLALVGALLPSVMEATDDSVMNVRVHLGIALIAIGFFALGLFDDIWGGKSAKGIRGHLGALKKGTLTSGSTKAAGGLGLGLLVSASWDLRLLPAVVGALIISASANLLNLLDLRPGRACKFYLLAWVPLAYIGVVKVPAFFPLSAGMAGAVAGWLPADLGEEGMLGDSGSNMLGGVLGAGIVLSAGPGAELVVLVVLLLLTVASEKYSFTRAIAGFRPLRWFDGLGRAPE